METYDVLVIGGGPGGSTAARYAAKYGLRTLMIEKRPEIGSPVRCGEGLSKGILNEADIKPDKSFIANEVKGARIYGPSEKRPIILQSEKAGNEVGFVLERDKFDKHLAALAAKAGADVWVKSPALGVIKEDGKVAGAKIRHENNVVEVRAKMVIAADGFESEFGRWAGLKSVILARNDIISALQYRMINIDVDPDYTDFYLGSIAPGGYIWVFPKGEGMANVGIGSSINFIHNRLELKNYLDRFIENHPGLKKGQDIQLVTGGVSVSKVKMPITMPGLMLVGDAARLIDPITGGGIANAIVSGMYAAQVSKEAIESNDYSPQMMGKYEKLVKDRFERKHLRNWVAKEKLAQLSDETLDKLVDIVSEQVLTTISVEAILKAIAEKYPEVVKELEDLI
ncbi:cofactor biosynthesis protein [Thermoplasma volcanium GSS1]|uniref:Digeranylgeranylglycerophospholipid reductase n=1 Tax=Thermoplasma volcanium (strain ATCC 51530 / DSM 4299 / JCM 9571 / NBRC 15438 / GSS1) TaxID=273116 RepID=GGR_THEVO|nr:digeranylgeranylglycerophospholipid reductase [Thermoplasma volcanium]Q979Y7.1 RecName: Full=Digeranylgeranylglycerophospholipid reductase; Short=DGGGPL reductase; AltName: Full=2,3-bis-O-geranylgeranylglyceryl phosphate reductase; AltName: Full=Geranylgeranyl reductase; Short=GGR [Thermoplasma volcanium GSS1]BAB60165.1 cofactor biosynthesis protein [Thermoplasma volcanium GSS1]